MVMRWEGDTIFTGILIADKDNIQQEFRLKGASGNELEQRIRHTPQLQPDLINIVPEAIRIDEAQLKRFFKFAFGSENRKGKYTGTERGFLIKEIYKSGGRVQYSKGKTGANTHYIVGEPFVIPSPTPELTEEQKKPNVTDFTTDLKRGRISLSGTAFNSADSGADSANYTVKFIYPNGVEKIATIKSFSDPRVINEQPDYPEVSDTLWKDMEPEAFANSVPQNTDLERGHYYTLKYNKDSVFANPYSRNAYPESQYETIKQYYTVDASVQQEGVVLSYRTQEDGKRQYNTIVRHKQNDYLTRLFRWRN